MRAALDTNLLLSSLISSGSVPDLVYRAWRDGLFELVTSEWQLGELERAGRYPRLQKYMKPRELDAMVGGIRLGAVVLEELPEVDAAPDPDDNPLLATALSGGAEYLVTGDKGVLGLKRFESVVILTARAFLEEVIEPIRNE
ncbi:MAG: putative toxin-antitoxin system toxin component, PIN family [Rubrobacter sp.]|nr:putative toxin-antitoxin system toxin component, PIN family [Rubrobacter sp.]